MPVERFEHTWLSATESGATFIRPISDRHFMRTYGDAPEFVPGVTKRGGGKGRQPFFDKVALDSLHKRLALEEQQKHERKLQQLKDDRWVQTVAEFRRGKQSFT
jgi:hypothetical protein